VLNSGVALRELCGFENPEESGQNRFISMNWNRKHLKDFQLRGLVRGLFDVQTHTNATDLDQKWRMTRNFTWCAGRDLNPEPVD
jgi:hypothetical protein